jgi:anti-sigma B factor antagonist
MGTAQGEPKTPVSGTVRLRADGVGLTLSGDLDLHSAPVLRDLVPLLLTNCRRNGTTEAQIDCTDLALCDSSGLTALIQAHQAAQDEHIRLVLTDRPGNLDHILDLAGLSRMFEPEKQ